MRAQALHVGVKKNYCYRTDTRTKNLLFEGTVDEQNRHPQLSFLSFFSLSLWETARG